MLNSKLKPYLRQLFPHYEDKDIDQIILFLIACKLNLDCDIEESIFLRLSSKEVIDRDFVNEIIRVRVPVFNTDEGDLPDIRIIEINDDDLKRYRKLFAGIRNGSMGDKNTVRTKLIQWLSRNDNYTIEDVIEAASQVIYNGDTKYIQNADNFIFNDKGQSPLSTAIDEMELTHNKQFK